MLQLDRETPAPAMPMIGTLCSIAKLIFQDGVIDPRQSQQYCLQAHERKKKFLSQLNIIPHKIVVSDEDKDDKLPANRFVLNCKQTIAFTKMIDWLESGCLTVCIFPVWIVHFFHVTHDSCLGNNYFPKLKYINYSSGAEVMITLCMFALQHVDYSLISHFSFQ